MTVFGDKLVDELAGLLNGMNSAFRLELRDLNDQNALRLDGRLQALESRFDGRLDKRIAELGAELRQEMAEIRSDIASLDAKMAQRGRR